MDPLSITLAVISLATAVKDMVELGQKIHESFTKVTKNLRKAQRVAKDIKEMVEKIKVFYENHQDALDNMTNFRVALLGLHAKFRSFETSTLSLLPKTGGRRLGLFMKGWWNNNLIEERILDLQGDIVQVMLEYMMDSAMRAEVKLEAIYQDTSRGLMNVHNGITQGLEVLEGVRRGMSVIAATMPHHSYKPSETTSDEINRNIIMLAQSKASTSAPMLRTPSLITEELVTAAYVKVQLNSIAETVEKMSTLPASALNSVAPPSVATFQLLPALESVASMSIRDLRHFVMRQVIGIRDLLDTQRIHTISIDEGASALGMLSAGLATLGMDDESMLVGKWAITLARTLVDASGGGQPALEASLAIYLSEQSEKDRYSGDKIQSLQKIQEAYTIAQNLSNQHKGKADFQILYSIVLLQYATLVDNERSIKMSVEAVQVLEDILHVQAFTQSKSQEIEGVVQSSSSFLDRLFSMAPTMTAIIDYAFALQELGIYLSVDGHSESALHLQLLAIAVRRKMVSIHGHEHKMKLASALWSLMRGRTASRIPAEELVDMANECIHLYRDLAEKNPVYYARRLVDVLWVKANTLGSLNRNAEAISTWEEIASLAGQIVQDSELCAAALGNLSDQFRYLERHDDAVRTGTLAITTYHEEAEIRGRRYFHLSKDLQRLWRYKESADAARTSVALYRQLAMKDPRRWMSLLSHRLSNLAHCLAALSDYSEALIIWQESVSVLDNLLNGNPDATSAVINTHHATLHTHTLISYTLKDKDKCLEVCSTAVRYFRRLSEICPWNAAVVRSLLWAEYCYSYNLVRFGCLQDAQRRIDHWPYVWSSNLPEAISEPDIATSHGQMIALEAEVLDAQGSTKQALLTIQTAHDIVRPESVSVHHPSLLLTIRSMVLKARLRTNFGDGKEALQIAEKALQLARDNKMEPIVRSLVWCLHAVAFTALSCQNYKRAVEVAREGCDIYANQKGLGDWQYSEHDAFVRPGLLAFMSSAEANLGGRSTALGYAHLAVDAALKIGGIKLNISATTAEWLYMDTRGNLADILLATGDHAQARQICEERAAYFSERAVTRMGDYRELAPILRMLGVLCCSEGHHEKGDAAAQELSRIMDTLGSAFPSLQEQVRIRLRHQTNVPILKVLNEMGQKLNCEHQAEVSSLLII